MATGGPRADAPWSPNVPLWPELSALDEVPEEDISAADRRGEAKHKVAEELIAGHLTLLEAAAQFRALRRAAGKGLPASGLLGLDRDIILG